MLDENAVLETLRRVPDRIILATMGRDLELMNANQCLCGWFVREKLAEAHNVGASALSAETDGPVTLNDHYSPSRMSAWQLFGGTEQEWYDIYVGVSDMYETDRATIERAFVQRVEEAVFPAKPARSVKRRSVSPSLAGGPK